LGRMEEESVRGEEKHSPAWRVGFYSYSITWISLAFGELARDYPHSCLCCTFHVGMYVMLVLFLLLLQMWSAPW
jgi:hypothetical protein